MFLLPRYYSHTLSCSERRRKPCFPERSKSYRLDKGANAGKTKCVEARAVDLLIKQEVNAPTLPSPSFVSSSCFAHPLHVFSLLRHFQLLLRLCVTFVGGFLFVSAS